MRAVLATLAGLAALLVPCALAQGARTHRAHTALFYAGAAKADVTPSRLSDFYLGGYGIGPVHPASGVLRHIYFRVIAVRGANGVQVVIGATATYLEGDELGMPRAVSYGYPHSVAIVTVGAVGHTWPAGVPVADRGQAMDPAPGRDDNYPADEFGNAVARKAIGALTGGSGRSRRSGWVTSPSSRYRASHTRRSSSH